MRKWLVRSGIVILILIAALVVIAAWSEKDNPVMNGYKQNAELVTIKPDWPGTPVDQKDRFMNHEFPFVPRAVDLLKWKLGGNSLKTEKQDDAGRLEVKDPRPFLESREDGIMWLGHASFYIRVNGVGILTDPVFGDPAFLKRFVPVPSPLEHLTKVDYVLLSHDHRDHMDEETLRAVAKKFPHAEFLAGLRSEDVLNEWKTGSNKIQTAGWFQEFDLRVVLPVVGGDSYRAARTQPTYDTGGVRIYFLPVRHWSRRGLFDTNWRLWGGYVIQTSSTTIYFGGDSGYGRHYREVGELFPKLDYLLIGVGAYEPRWFMEPNHNNPSDVVKAFMDSGARYLVPMHYGTFDLSDEPPSQPIRFLLEEAEKHGARQQVVPLAINDSLPIMSVPSA